MDNPPEEQEGLYKALYNCNQSLPDDSRFVVPFICVSAIPCGLLYKENLEGIPTVTDTYNALLNYDKTNQVAIPMIKSALRIAGCPSDKIEQIQGTSIQEASLQRDCEHASEIHQGLRFHELLVGIINDLPSDLKRQVISTSSGHLLSNSTHTELLHVQFLRLIQANVIGRKDVSKLHSWLESIRRNDILDLIDKYCTDVGTPILPRQDIQHPMETPLDGDLYPNPIQETAGESSRLPAINRGQVHNTEQHIVEPDNPSGPSELQACANGGENTGEPHSTDSSAAKCCDHAMSKDQKRKCCTLVTTLAATLLAICIILFTVFEFYPPISGRTFLQALDVVTLSNNGFDPFHYTAVTVTRAREDSKSHVVDASQVTFYLQTCSKLVPRNRPIHTEVSHINSSSEDSRFSVYQGYLLKGSEVSFSVNITAHTEFAKCSAALYIFQDYECLGNFLYYGSDVKNCSTRQICLLISSALDQQPPYTFMADETSYYFVALSAPRGIDGVNDIYFQTTGTQVYYTAGDLSPACSIIGGINSSCPMTLPNGQAFQLSPGKSVCVLAVLMADSTDTNSTVTTYLAYSSSTSHNPVHNIAKLVTLLLVLLLFATTVVVLCICIRICRSHDYQSLSTGRE